MARDRVYEMGRVFRNEGIDSSHSAEFTMLEAYQSWGDQRTIAQLIHDIIVAAADAVGSRQVETDQGTIRPRRSVAVAAVLRRAERGRGPRDHRRDLP